MAQPTVVIVEDDVAIAQALAFIAEKEGYRVLVAMDGNTAGEMIRREQPVLVILDLDLPQKNGLEVCRDIRAEPQLGGTYILVLTALGQRWDEEAALAAGANEYLRKPFDPHLIRDKLQALRPAS
ncbi:MAG TPA: response regulator transcription factor [Armatimonadetes bacterium]|nr:response regulator transcription factor [Armatimonadota bacterium]